MMRIWSLRSLGTKTMSTAATSGITMRARSACPCSTLTLHCQAGDGQHRYPESHAERVVRQLTGLEVLQHPAVDRFAAGEYELGSTEGVNVVSDMLARNFPADGSERVEGPLSADGALISGSMDKQLCTDFNLKRVS